jgi:hypothetical protein
MAELVTTGCSAAQAVIGCSAARAGTGSTEELAGTYSMAAPAQTKFEPATANGMSSAAGRAWTA